jgi:hypothetical protein
MLAEHINLLIGHRSLSNRSDALPLHHLEPSVAIDSEYASSCSSEPPVVANLRSNNLWSSDAIVSTLRASASTQLCRPTA